MEPSASVPEMMQRENALFARIGNQADAREGVLSFLEKRDPDWKLSAARNLPEGFQEFSPRQPAR